MELRPLSSVYGLELSSFSASCAGQMACDDWETNPDLFWTLCGGGKQATQVEEKDIQLKAKERMA